MNAKEDLKIKNYLAQHTGWPNTIISCTPPGIDEKYAVGKSKLKNGLKTICTDNILIVNVLFEYMVRSRRLELPLLLQNSDLNALSLSHFFSVAYVNSLM